MNKATLKILLGIAKNHIDDIESGIEDGAYDAADNPDLPAKKEAMAEALIELNEGPKTYDSLLAVAGGALVRARTLFDEALPKFDWGKSALDANAIRLLNEVPREVKTAIGDLKKYASDKTMRDNISTRTVPVLTTAHLTEYAAQQFCGYRPSSRRPLVAPWREGCFVFMGSPDSLSVPEGETDYVLQQIGRPIREWFHKNYPEDCWLAFDSDGDESLELKVYDW